MSRVLVIRLGALGDFVQSFAPFAAIREHHPVARIRLLTTKPFLELGERAPWFDDVVLDERPPWWNLPALARLSRSLRGYDMVYDLQTSARSSRYFSLAGNPPWSGIAKGCSAPHSNPRRDFMHTRERQREQLEMAGITYFPVPDLSWLAAGRAPKPLLPDTVLHGPYALLVPGAAAHRPAKRWPTGRFAALAQELATRGTTPVVIGGPADGELAGTILAACPSAIDLTGRTSIAEIGAIAGGAVLAIGNDTGPMHLAASVGCPCIVLFSKESDPDLTCPRYPDGGWPVILRMPNLADLRVDRVAAALP